MDIPATTTLLTKHLALWSETDEARRTPVISEIYTEGIHFVDPFFAISGRTQVNAFIADLLKKNPGYVFRLAGPIEAHHNVAYLGWQFGPPATPAAVTGHDIFVLADERIQLIYTFIDGATGTAAP
ncbi:nuclear transport factor 2 family protein [Hymenobacter terricola]|uniref:nuclear transport factor 2 family protein n=1 Tax=Hymenobacter terricola TaxID=2819236 RepID=UPI001B3070DD|nr:nuclear transport factor 2 family protein [Hymenobacter terricola]